MRHLVSRRKALLLSSSLFLFSLIALILTGQWWPGIMLAVGLPLALRQYLMGRNYDVGITLLVFVGTFITVSYDIAWEVLLPTLFTLGAIYVFAREWLEAEPESEEDLEEDINHELEEEKKD